MSDTATTLEAPAPIEANEQTAPAWAAVSSLTLGVFGLVTAEFLPASLLTRMASDLRISDGAAGQAVTTTAVIAGISALTLAVVTRRIDRRPVLWTLTLLLVLSNVLAATASGLPGLLLARVLLGIGLGGFWSMAAATVMRLVPMRLMPRAMSVVFTGVSVATVCAAPVGAYVGDLWGWRVAFLIAAGIGAIALLVQIATMPRLPPVASASFRTLGELLGRPAMRVGLIVLVLAISGHFAGFTYVRPFLEEVPVLKIEAVSLILLAYGIGGFFGNLAGGFVAERSIWLTVALGSLFIAVLALVLLLFGTSAVLAGVAVALWGFAFGWLPVGFQTWAVRAAPDHAESAGGLLVTAFQVAITCGAVFGGLLVDGFGPLGAIGYAGLATLTGAVVTVAFAPKEVT